MSARECCCCFAGCTDASAGEVSIAASAAVAPAACSLAPDVPCALRPGLPLGASAVDEPLDDMILLKALLTSAAAVPGAGVADTCLSRGVLASAGWADGGCVCVVLPRPGAAGLALILLGPALCAGAASTAAAIVWGRGVGGSEPSVAGGRLLEGVRWYVARLPKASATCAAAEPACRCGRHSTDVCSLHLCRGDSKSVV